MLLLYFNVPKFNGIKLGNIYLYIQIIRFVSDKSFISQIQPHTNFKILIGLNISIKPTFINFVYLMKILLIKLIQRVYRSILIIDLVKVLDSRTSLICTKKEVHMDHIHIKVCKKGEMYLE